MIPSSIVRGLAAISAVSALILAGPAHAQGKGETVRIQDYAGTGNMLARVAISKGYCDKYGIKCTVQRIPTGPLGAQALLAKSIDVGLFSADVMTPAIANGAKMKIISGGAVTNVGIIMVGNHVDAPNAEKGFPAMMRDMKGKKVGTPARGSAMERLMSSMLTKAGMSPDDVTFVAVGGPDTAYGALVSKQVDYLVNFEPSGAMCDVLKTCRALWRGAVNKEPAETFAMNGGGSAMVVRQEMIDQSPHVADALVAAFKDADAFLNNPANYKEVKQIAEQYFKFEFPKGDEVLDRVLKLTIDTHTYTAGIDRNAITHSLKYYNELKALDRVLPISDLVDPRAPNWVK